MSAHPNLYTLTVALKRISIIIKPKLTKCVFREFLFLKKIVDLQFADFARDNPELFFEHAGEILRIFKT